MRLSSFLFLPLMVLAAAGCGNNRQLQSLSISPASQTAQNGQGQFIASGQFNTMPMSESPVQVDWHQVPPVFDPPSTTITFTLTSQPFTARCVGLSSGAVITVIAFAPMDTSKSSGSMPLSVFSDLVLTRNATQESG